MTGLFQGRNGNLAIRVTFKIIQIQMSRFILLCFIVIFSISMSFRALQMTSGNPIFRGWYADPEARIFKKTYWVYPTYSDKYDKQVYFDAFSSTDLVTWTKHSR